MPGERNALYGPEPGASEAWADMATADSHSGVPVDPGDSWGRGSEPWAEVELAARRYARFTHGNLSGDAYRRREEARDQLLDALAQLDSARGG